MRFIPPLHCSLGQLLCKALPAFHALTSCDLSCKELAKRLQLSKFDGDSVLNESTLRSGEELLCTSYSPKECFAKAHDFRNCLWPSHYASKLSNICLETSYFVYADSSIAWWKWIETRGRQIGSCVNVKIQRAKEHHRANDMPLQPVSLCLELFLWSEQPFLHRSMYVYGRWKLPQSMESASLRHIKDWVI